MWSHISILLVPASGSLKKQNAARVLVGWSIGKRKLLEIVFRGARARPQHNERVWHLAPVKYTHLILLNAWAKQTPLLGKGGVDAPSRNIPVPLKGADGVVRSNSKTISLERTTPSAPAKLASRHFFNRRSHPSFAKEGT